MPLGIDGDVKAYLSSAWGPGGAQRFRFPEEVVELRTGDLALHELEQRAAAEGTDLNAVATDALRAGAHAA